MSIFTDTWINDLLQEIETVQAAKSRSAPRSQNPNNPDPRTITIDIKAEVIKVKPYLFRKNVPLE